ncbi:chromate efflux transporter [Thalassotalea ponticola]|uniref:chromate efflux transporter n=1 Tax=Thalassotalea ponticola TaxID=1523392 RepID=UPI0025B4EAB6|nr:chromate efflux transporter [Thalassotalea ponticola]MDN3652511.1 chromate efflux transporter [Thalassotalea ponticola]
MDKVFEVFKRFLWLGLISLGGPAAHIGYFQKAFVEQYRWLDDHAYGKLVALSQFLPGPGSSQVGFALGLQRAGLLGGIAAFVGFTLPSFVIMYGLAKSYNLLAGDTLNSIIHGLKLLAVVVVADASLSMYNSFCKNRLTTTIAVISFICLLLLSSIQVQMLLLVVAAATGAIYCHTPPQQQRSAARLNYLPLIAFVMLFVSTLYLAQTSGFAQTFAYFYQSGALVFGGGHVVLPLLQETAGQGIANDTFLMGYAAAQAVPGPMFSLAAFLGGQLHSTSPFLGALLATLAIFLPGFLLVLSLQGVWQSLSTHRRVGGAVIAINAAVVGILLSALYSPVFTSAVTSAEHMAIVALGLLLQRVYKLPIAMMVLLFVLIGLFL